MSHVGGFFLSHLWYFLLMHAICLISKNFFGRFDMLIWSPNWDHVTTFCRTIWCFSFDFSPISGRRMNWECRLVSELKCGVRNQEFVIIPRDKAFSVEWKGSCPGAVLWFLLLSVQAFIQMERLSVELKQVLDGNN